MPCLAVSAYVMQSCKCRCLGYTIRPELLLPVTSTSAMPTLATDGTGRGIFWVTATTRAWSRSAHCGANLFEWVRSSVNTRLHADGQGPEVTSPVLPIPSLLTELAGKSWGQYSLQGQLLPAAEHPSSVCRSWSLAGTAWDLHMHSMRVIQLPQHYCTLRTRRLSQTQLHTPSLCLAMRSQAPGALESGLSVNHALNPGPITLSCIAV